MTRTNVFKKLIALSLLLTLLSINLHISAEECSPWVAKAISIQGDVEKRLSTNKLLGQWVPIKRNNKLCAGEIIRVKQNSRAALILRNDTILRLNQNTTITLSSFNDEQSYWVNLEKGIAHFIARIKQSFKVVTPFVNAAVEGTEFVITVNSTQSEVIVFEGIVKASNKLGEVKLLKGQTAVATRNTAPSVIIKVNPRDAVQWSLYYPAIINYKNIQFKNIKLNNKTKIIIKQSITAIQKGKINLAISLIETIPSISTHIELLIYKTALYLSIGRINSAYALTQFILQLQANNPQAIALQSIIATVQNKKIKAIALAKQAAIHAPNDYEPALALSYAYQSQFDIKNALSSIKLSLENNKNNALLWSRLSELYLMTGDVSNALNSAKEAMISNPNISRTHITLGFAYLSQNKINKAQQAFEEAIEIDDTDPLSHLGLGLAIIRQGNLLNGRQQIEFAATLDPNNALIRSYLGKAYNEEKRHKLASVQFDMAKMLDPKDPTAFLYDAILKQNLNNPVTALENLQKANAINKNRAVFRSKLLLKQDDASSNVSQAQIYKDLGYNQLALNQGWKSLNRDQANHSAHRFLADTYALTPRHEIGRLSELLQSQLWQPLTLTQIQPQLVESGIGIIEEYGPSKSNYNEYTSLFTRNQNKVKANMLLGGNKTISNDLVLSGLYNSIAYSLGQYHYETDGFRKNNDQKQDATNIFLQYSINPNTTIQFEYSDFNGFNGDLALRADPKEFSTDLREVKDIQSYKFGLRHDINNNSKIIFSYITKDSKESQYNKPLSNLSTNLKIKEKPYNAEIQYLFQTKKNQYLFGIGDYQSKNDRLLTTKIDLGFPVGIVTTPIPSSFTNFHSNQYIYSNLAASDNLNWTIGLSHDVFDGSITKKDIINPKLGVTWSANTNINFRFAAFQVLKRDIVSNQTIEPTHVAGFNQFFDDDSGAISNRVGAAVDIEFNSSLNSGIELSKRKIDHPYIVSSQSLTTKWTEVLYRVYQYWTINNFLSSSIEYSYEQLDYGLNDAKNGARKITTQKIPISLNYFHPNGLGLKTTAVYLDQKSSLFNSVTNITQKLNSDNLLVNLELNYRLYRLSGILTLGVSNVFDTKVSFQEPDPKNPQYYPEQYVYSRVSINF